jgi:diketogulonate reductase-like aldo/keto reductase
MSLTTAGDSKITLTFTRRNKMIIDEKFTLSNGIEIPKLGLGTWLINDKEVVQAVKDAVKIGYRHIDTAQAYQNEHGVGEGIKASGVNRQAMFVTTKLAAEVKSYKKAVAAIDNSLKALQLDYVDLMIIHSPKPWTEFHKDEPYFEGNREAWRALEEAYKSGKLRAIGLSNFEKADIDNILGSCSVKPMVNQILAHISNTPMELIQYTQAKGILVEAYSPVAHGELLKNTQVSKLAEKYGVSVPQLSIRYVLQLGLLPLPKTVNPEHMKNNADVDFVISDADMDVLKNVEKIKDYGSASMMPVFGGKLDLKSMLSMAIHSKRRSD